MENGPKDSNGNLLSQGDNVQVIKDLKVGGSSNTIKRGTLIKNIKLNGSSDTIEAKVDKCGVVVLKTCFLKKS